MKVTISVRAYAKILLHACKYPHKAVNGVVLADTTSQGPGMLHVADVVPLFHQCLGLAPMLEVALAQIEAYCKATKMQLVGYYQANENVSDIKPNWMAYKITEKIAEYYNNAVLLMVDNTKMGAECSELALKLYTYSENKWKQRDDWDLESGERTEALTIVSDLITNKAYQSVVDFDNHLDDISQDWLNPDINKLVDLVTS